MSNLDNLEETIKDYCAYSTALGYARTCITQSMHRIKSTHDHGVITTQEAETSLAFVETLIVGTATASTDNLTDIASVADVEKQRLWDMEMTFKHKYGLWTYFPESEKALLSPAEKERHLELDKLRLADISVSASN
jgi:hypothetical protein